MDLFWVITSAVFGLMAGSFLNVVINRLWSGKTFRGRSECPHCQHSLAIKDLVPVLSFVFLKGKCRYCTGPISWQYPAVELGTALSFLLVATRYPMGPEAFFVMVLACFFVVVGVYDYKHFLILDRVVALAFMTALALALYQDFTYGCQFGLNLGCASVSGLLGVLTVSGFFLLQYLVSKGTWIGFGDVKFGAVLGMTAGFPLVLFLLFVGYMIGAGVGVGLIAAGRKDMGSQLPFGTFLAFSAIITMLYGQQLMGMYLNLIGF